MIEYPSSMDSTKKVSLAKINIFMSHTLYVSHSSLSSFLNALSIYRSFPNIVEHHIGCFEYGDFCFMHIRFPCAY